MANALRILVLRLCSVKTATKAQGENWVFSNRQNEIPGNAMFFVSNLMSSSQAGRRGFESRLPLQEINKLASPVLKACSKMLQNSLHITGSEDSSASTASFRLATEARVYTF